MPFLYMGAFTFVSKFAPATQSGNSFHRAHINFTFFSCLCFRRYLCFFIFIFLFNKTKSQIKQQQAFSTNMQDTLRWGLARSVHNENGGKIREFRNERESGPSLLPQRFLGLLLATRERILGSLRFNDATATRTCKKKKNRFNTLFRTFLYRFCTSTTCKFYGERKQATTKFYFAFWTWKWSLGIQIQKGSRTFDKASKNQRDKDWKNANSLFRRRCRCYSVVGFLSPYWQIADRRIPSNDPGSLSKS